MKIYKKYILLLLSGTLLSLQGCSTQEKVVEEKKEETILEEDQKETSNLETNESEIDLEEEKKESLEDQFTVTEEVAEEMENSSLGVIDPDKEIDSEEEIVEYFNDLAIQSEVNTPEEYEESKTTIQSALATFVLFLNDEMTIKDYTFSSLTDTTKEKLMNIFERFDNKMNELVPGYSKPIITAFTFIKEKGQQGKLILSNSLGEAFGEEFMDETKDNFKDGYQDMKDSFGFWKDKILEKAREEVKEK